MAEENLGREELIHQLRNMQAEKQALKHLLLRATNLIERLVEHDCEEPHRQEVIAEAERLRRAVT
jgi:hypothetical protein